MELGLVNFKKRDYKTEVLNRRNQKIAKLMNIPLSYLDQYTIVELSPFSQILLNLHLNIEFSPLRFYSLEELDDEIYFFVENTTDLFYANTLLKTENPELKDLCLKKYEDSLAILPAEFFENILGTQISLNWRKNKPVTGFSSTDLRIIAVIPNTSKLIQKKFQEINLEKLDEIREILYNYGMINKKDNSKYFFIINRIN